MEEKISDLQRLKNELEQLRNPRKNNLIQKDTTLPQRSEAETEKNKGGFVGGVGYTAEKLGLGVLRSLEGISDFVVGGIADLFGGDEFAENLMKNDWVNYSHADEWYDPGKGWQFVGDVAGGVGNMLPSIIITAATAGAAAPVALAGSIASTGQFIGSAMGQSVSEATKETGSLGGKEWLYGTASGALEGGIEAISGGIGGTQVGKVLGKQLGKSTLGKIGMTVAGEGLEEVASDIANPLLKRATGVDENAKVDWKELPRTFAVGGVTGAVMGGGKRVLDAAKVGGFNNLNAAETTQELTDRQADNNIRQLKGKTATYTQEDIARTKENLSKRLQKMDVATRAQFLQANANIANQFNEDGTVKSVAPAPDTYNTNAYSASLQGREGTFAYKPISESSKTTVQAKQVMDTLTKITDGKTNIVLTEDALTTESGGNANGLYKDGIIYLNANATDYQKALTVGVHEVIHGLEGTKEYEQLAKAITEEIKNTPDLAQQYNIDKYRAAYDSILEGEWTETTKDYQAVTEIFADFLANKVANNEQLLRNLSVRNSNVVVRFLNWVRNSIAKLGESAEERAIRKDLKKFEKMLVNALEAGTGGISLERVEDLARTAEKRLKTQDGNVQSVKFSENKNADGKIATARASIEKAVGGRDVVIIEMDILEGVPKSKWIDVVKDAISRFKPAIPISGKLIKVNADTVNEYLNSDYTTGIKKYDKVTYVDKMRASNQLDEIILATTNYVNEDLKHKRKDNIKEFARGEVLMKVGNNKYKAEVVVGFTSGKNMVLYDIVNFTKTDFSLTKKKVESPERQVSLIQEKQPSTPIIRENSEKSTQNAKKVEKTSTSRSSLNVDSEGNSLTAEQAEYFKDSKVRDKDGNLLVMYHGTGNDFTVFNNKQKRTRGRLNFGEGFYFASNKGSAENYIEGENRRIIEAYVDIQKPYITYIPSFDYDDIQKIQKEFPEAERGFITYATITKYLKKLGYDGVIQYNVHQALKGNKVIEVAMAFNPNQIKNTTNKTPTKNADIRYSIDVDGKNIGGNGEVTKNLVALHNLSESNLLRVIGLGGFPMPSIAVTTTELPHESYGDITVVFGRETIDPESDSRNVVYDRDAWTPTTPTVDVKLSNQKVDSLIKNLQGDVGDNSTYKRSIFSFFDGKYRDNNGDYVVPEYDYTREQFGERAIKNSGIVAAYLSEKGVKVEPVYTERGFTMGWASFTRKEAADLFDFVGITEDVTRDNATQEQRDAILEKYVEYQAKKKLPLFRRFKKNPNLTVEDAIESIRKDYDDGDVSQLFFMAEDFFNKNRPKDIYDEQATIDKMQDAITDKQDFYDWFWDKIEATFEKKGIDNDSDVFDRWGNRRSFEQRHFAYTASNIVKAMAKGEQEGKAGFGITAGSLAAKLSKRFESIENIHEAKEYLALVSEDDLKAFNDKTYELYDELVTAIAGKSSDFLSDSHRRDDVGDILGKCAGAKPLTIENIKRIFDRETRGYNLGYKFNNDIAEQTLLLFESLKHIPTTYFEAKPRRVVALNEIKNVLIPQGASENLVKALKAKHIPYTEYNEWESRSSVIKNMDNARFSIDVDLDNKTTERVQTVVSDEKLTLKERWENTVEKLKEGRLDQWMKAQIAWTDEQAGILGAGKNVGVVLHGDVQRARSAKAAAMNMLNNEQRDFSGKKRVGDSLKSIFQPIQSRGKQVAQDFNLYLLHQLNVDRMSAVERGLSQENKYVFEEKVDKAFSQEKIQQLEKKYPEFKEAAKKVWNYNKNLLQYRVDAGLITQEQADQMTQMYPHYVPAFYEKNGGSGTSGASVGNKGIAVRTGIKKAKGSTGVSDIKDVPTSIAKQTVAVVRAASINNVVSKLYDGAVAKNDFTDIEEVGREKVANPDVDYDKEIPKVNQVYFYKDGERITLDVTDYVYAGFQGLTAQAQLSDPLTSVSAKLISLFKKSVTSWNPLFAATNAIRDAQEALFYTKYGAFKLMGNYGKSLFMRKHDPKLKELWQQYVAMGGTGSGYFSNDTGVYDARNKVKKGLAAAMEKFTWLNEWIEQTPRFAEFVASVEAGNSVEQALYDSAEVTTNFSRGGTVAKKLNRTLIPFLNPSIQGWSKLWRSWVAPMDGKSAAEIEKLSKQSKGRQILSKWGTTIFKAVAVGISVGLFNDMLYRWIDEDEDYANLPLNIKENYYLLKVGGKFIKIPKGRVVALYGSVATRISEAANGNEEALDAWNWGKSASEMVSPLESASRTIFAPFYDVATNTTWYGGQIESASMENLAQGERYDEGTSSIAIAIGKAINYSPKKIHYLIDQYSGVIGDLILPATTNKAEKDMLSSRFMVDPVYNNDISTKYYNYKDELTYAKNSGDVNAKLMLKYMNEAQDDLTEMYQKKRDIANDKSLSDKEKAAQTSAIQSLINGTLSSSIDAADEFEQLIINSGFEQAVALLEGSSEYQRMEQNVRSSAYNRMVDYYYEVCLSALTNKKLDTKYVLYGALNAPDLMIYLTDINNIESDKDKKGNTIQGSRKEKVQKYIQGLKITVQQKYILSYLAGYAPTNNGKSAISKYLKQNGYTQKEVNDLWN